MAPEDEAKIKELRIELRGLGERIAKLEEVLGMKCKEQRLHLGCGDSLSSRLPSSMENSHD